uniref:Chemokine interleukin-8-like domain-containing protein n=1 Tax=Oryzias latipes TaxID=8090 RepID=H2MKE9_ORYLA
MKTLCFSLGLLLFVVCCSDATGKLSSTNTAGPEKCCFKFSERQLPLKRVTGIIRTHHSCQHQAFVSVCS